MTERQLSAIYKSACAAAGRLTDPMASAGWKAVLLHFSREEVTAALDTWWNDTEPVQGSLVGRPRGATMPKPADLKACIRRARERAYQGSAEVQRRKQEIREFWRIADERGMTDEEVREKWPSYVGTRPKARQEDAA